MILPIYLYGEAALRKPTGEIDKSYPELKTLIDNMFETLTNAEGCGLAAPQVGKSIRLFVVDGTELGEDYPDCVNFKQVFINPEIVEESKETNVKDEGCLSIPGVYEGVKRPDWIVINYLDENLEEHEERLEGFAARMVLHEYDHLDGKMFIDRVSPLRKPFIKNKLQAILKGKNHPDYKHCSLR